MGPQARPDGGGLMSDAIDTGQQAFNWREHLPVHPAADLFPLLSPDDLKTLADDIMANGMQHRIPLWGDPVAGLRGCQLIDGRNRLDALALLGFLGVTKNGGLIVTKRSTKDGWVDSADQPFCFYHKG